MGEREGERVIKKIKNYQLRIFNFYFFPFSKRGTKWGFLSPYAFFSGVIACNCGITMKKIEN